METNNPMAMPLPENALAKLPLRKFFITHLDHIYCAKTHLVTRLPELADMAHFQDLKNAIFEVRDEVEKQIVRLEQIYTLFDAKQSQESFLGWKGLLNDAFKDITEHGESPESRDLSLLFYMQNIESLEMASFKVLQIAATKINNQKISQLLKESYDDATDDRTLLLMIMSKYVSGEK
ncbi:hypothetical protein A0256_00075 [Mucilaginibacter sp. PAMC 26640]|nr:hypothetical protein A0256_00075 [Mucilaginibacter sp. PAMC 26640]